MVTYALIPASDLALASSARLTDLLALVRVTNRFRLTGVWPLTSSGLGDLLVDPAQGAPGPVVLVLVVERVVTAGIGRPGSARAG